MEEKNLHVEEGALKVTKLTLYEAVAIIVGANVGSGILGLAYSSRLAGWPILVLWLAVAGLFTTFSMLYVAESALRTKKQQIFFGFTASCAAAGRRDIQFLCYRSSRNLNRLSISFVLM